MPMKMNKNFVEERKKWSRREGVCWQEQGSNIAGRPWSPLRMSEKSMKSTANTLLNNYQNKIKVQAFSDFDKLKFRAFFFHRRDPASPPLCCRRAAATLNSEWWYTQTWAWICSVMNVDILKHECGYLLNSTSDLVLTCECENIQKGRNHHLTTLIDLNSSQMSIFFRTV